LSNALSFEALSPALLSHSTVGAGPREEPTRRSEALERFFLLRLFESSIFVEVTEFERFLEEINFEANYIGAAGRLKGSTEKYTE
jgi:hypothetical protein